MKTLHIVTAILLILTSQGKAQSIPFFYGGGEYDFTADRNYIKNYHRQVYSRSAATNERLIYESMFNLESIEGSSDGKYVACIEVQSGTGSNTKSVSRLLVLRADGQLYFSVDHVYLFKWNSSGDKIAYVTGKLREGGVGFSATDSWILDVKKRKSERLNFKTHDLMWADYDGNLYYLSYETGRVMKYNPRTRHSDSTHFRGIYFSRDGSYYFAKNYDGLEFRLYTRDNQDITKQFSRTLKKDSFEPEPMWLSNNKLIVPRYDLNFTTAWTNEIYNVEKDLVEGRLKGKILSINRGNYELLLINDQGQVVSTRLRSE